MLKPLPFLVPFYLDDVGVPLAGGKLYTWANNTQTDKPTWQDPLGNALNTNPIILNGGGRFDCFLEPGLYTMRLTDSLDQLIWERDDVSGEDTAAFTVVEAIADMKALVSGSLSQVFVLGYNTPGDGGGGAFIYDESLSLAEDFGVTFIGNDAPATGRWVRMEKDEISVRYFGAVGDGVTDDKIAIENAIAYCTSPGHSRTLFAPGSPTTPYIYYMATNPTGLDGSLGRFTFKVYDGAQLKFDVIPTIACNYNSGSYRNFAVGSQDPLFDAICTFEQGPYPEWWGAVNDGTGDQSIPIDAWLNCGAQLLYTSAGTYEVVGVPGYPSNAIIIMGGIIKEAANPPYIRRGIRIFGGGSAIEFAEAFGGDITSDDIVCDLLTSGGNVVAGNVGEGNLLQRIGSGDTIASPAVSTQGTQVSDAGVSTSGTGVDKLMERLVEADSLKNDGDSLRITAAGIWATSANSVVPINFFFKEVAFGTILSWALDNSGAGGHPANPAWFLVVTITKVGSKLLIVGNLSIDIFGVGAFLTPVGSGLPRLAKPAIATNADKTFQIYAEDVVGTDPITQHLMLVEYIKSK